MKTFAGVPLGADQKFRESPAAVAMSLNPVGPNHVVVTPCRGVETLHELEVEEYTSLWRFVREVEAAAEEARGGSASNIAVKDGAAAGTPVPMCHLLTMSSTAFR